jgi:SAM-dependent methyltransferase
MLRALAAAVHSARLRISVDYHSRCLARYWDSGAATHADMGAERFDLYAAGVAAQLGPADRIGLVLDHGAGRGEIGVRLAERGYRVEFSELSQRFVSDLRARNLVCYFSHEIPAIRYDAVFANNALLYVHPRLLTGEIARLLRAVKPGGRLLIMDVPVLQRMARLPAGPAKRLWWRLTKVIQPAACGFFIDQTQVCHAFRNTRVLDSWSSYRVHFEIER